jgi:hypothetical protein
VIRSHYGNGFIKQYVRDRFCLRTESAINDVTDYGVKKAVENLPELHEKLVSICDNYLTVQQGHPGDLCRPRSTPQVDAAHRPSLR